MKTLKLFLILAFPLIAGCANREKAPAPVMDGVVLPIKPSSELVRDYALSNDFIDVNFKAVEKATLNPASRSEDVTEEDFAKVWAAAYRFYRHVSLEDSMYVWDINNGADINISEEIFNAFTNNLDEANAAVKEWNAKGEKVDLRPITEEYLESLLN